jgi:predicted alpha/beta hydrolase
MVAVRAYIPPTAPTPAAAAATPAAATPVARDLALAATDGVPLVATHVAPLGPARGAVLIAPAMGVPQRYYATFAAWLAARGFHALTFDYRGSGRSRRGSLRAVDADLVTWARRDATAALRQLQDLAPGLPLTWIGHSLGGQLVPFVPDHRELARIITVAAGSGYWRDNSPALRRKVWLLWYLAVPLTTPLWGYFPGRALGMVGDLPRGVIRQWRRWCLDPGYAVGAEGQAVAELFERVRTPITALSFTDDEMMSARSIDGLHRAFRGAAVTHVRLAPGDVGRARLGHFGWFRDEHAPLWDQVVAPHLAAAPR